MTSAFQIRQQVERRRRRAMLVLVGIGAAVLLLSALALMGGGGHSTSAVPTTPSVPLAPPQGAAGYVPPAQSLTPPAPGRLLEGRWPVNFPHTPQGAVAANAAFLIAGWTLDQDQAVRAMDVYMTASDRAQAKQAVPSIVQPFLTNLGVQPGQAIPSDAYLTITPLAAHWQVLDSDHVVVAMMTRQTLGRSSDSHPVSESEVTNAGILVWDPTARGGDWLNTATDARKYIPAMAEPGTQAFNAAGWVAITHLPGQP